MPTPDPKKAAAEAAKKTQALKEKLAHNPVTKAAGDIFSKIQAKTGIDNKKVDEWQKKWMAMPEKRKKYEHLIDAPQVAAEEMMAMTNDIIDFIQGEEGGKSEVLKKLEAEGSEFVHHPFDYLKAKYAKGKEVAKKASVEAKKGWGKAKDAAKKTKELTEKTKKITKK